VFGWIAPILWGIHLANQKGYSSAWMITGIYPFAGWISLAILYMLPSKIQCHNCGGFMNANFILCPHCHEKI
jgi:hypothetical protein